MRPEPQKEIDLLLRQLSRRNGTPVTESDEQHLDADELNSYVANALPQAARARYTEHLADCSSCRKLVVQLSAAQAPVVAHERANVVAPSGLKSLLASLLSPMVLRYAVPALGLLVIAVVGIVFFQKDQSGRSVAHLENTDQNKSVSPTTPEVNAPAIQAARPASAPVSKKKEVAKDAPVVANEPAPTVANEPAEPPPPRPAKAAPVEVEAKRIDELGKEKQQQVADKTSTADASRNRSDDGVSNYQKPPEVAAVRRLEPQRRTAAPAAGVATAAAGRDESGRSREAPKVEGLTLLGETRFAGGRRFRKSGSVWIDTAYQSSQSTTNVARGSEQYRALVADEPTIGTIADQLDGEIIVVWKGRAYRIR